MELTVESAFSIGGLVGNLSYILLILSMAMRDILWLRILAILSGACGITYDVFWLNDPVGTFWESCFTLVNLIQWLVLIYEKRSLRLTKIEKVLHQNYFSGLSDIEFKQLLKVTGQRRVGVGETLTVQGQPVPELLLIVAGEVDILVDGQCLARRGPGDFIGEISFLTGSEATATSLVKQQAALMIFDKDRMSVLARASSNLSQVINNLVSKNLANKLATQTKRGVEKPGISYF